MDDRKNLNENPKRKKERERKKERKKRKKEKTRRRVSLFVYCLGGGEGGECHQKKGRN